MKGGATSVGISSGVSVGRPSGVAVSRGSGSLRSPEGSSSGGAKATWGSQNLSMFREMPISKAQPSMLNVGNGQEGRSKYATSSSLSKQRSMFDIQRSTGTVGRESTPPQSFNPKLDINHGRNVNSKTARTASLAPQRGMFYMSKPVVREWLSRTPSAPRATEARPNNVNHAVTPNTELRNKTVAERTRVVGLNPRNGAERVKTVDAFRGTIVLWQKGERVARLPQVPSVPRAMESRPSSILIDLPRGREIKADHIRKPSLVPKPRMIDVSRPIVQVDTAKPQAEVRTSVKNLITERVRVVPNSLAAIGIKQDIQDVEKAVAVMQAVYPQLTELQAKRSLVGTLLEGYRRKAGVMVLPEAKTEPATDVNTQPEVKPDVKAQAAMLLKQKTGQQEQALKMEAVKQEQKKKEELVGKKRTKKNVFYYERDERAINSRIDRAMHAFQFLSKYWDKNEPISGKDVVYQMGIMTDETKSEVKRPLSEDGSQEAVIRAIAMQKEIENATDFKAYVAKLAHAIPAVKLALQRRIGLEASEKDAEVVFNGPLDQKIGYFEENGQSLGHFEKGQDTMWFVPVGSFAVPESS